MRAVGVNQFGGPEALEVVELPEVHAGPGEVRVRVRAATVNPTDTALRSGKYFDPAAGTSPPYVPGMDMAGVIDEVGPDTTNGLEVGDAVMAMVIPHESHGAYRESIVLEADSVARTPEGASLVEAATLPMNGLTAWYTIELLNLRPGRTLAVTGAAGCFGGYLVQQAKIAGLRVIADASEADDELVRSLGADVVVRRGDDIAQRILAEVPEGVDGLADGAVQNELALPAVRDGGGFASVRNWTGGAERGITFHKVWVFDLDHRADLLDELRRQVESGAVTLRVADTIAMENAADAHRRFEAGGVRGRLVLTF